MSGTAAREAVIDLLKEAGLAEHVSYFLRRRRKGDPAPLPDPRRLGASRPGGDHKKPGQLAKSLEMAGLYAETARAAGWAAGISGIIWHHALLAKADRS
jgi:hypothetical protein